MPKILFFTMCIDLRSYFSKANFIEDFSSFVEGVDRVSVLLPIAIDILMATKSSHVPVFCVDFEVWGIIAFT